MVWLGGGDGGGRVVKIVEESFRYELSPACTKKSRIEATLCTDKRGMAGCAHNTW